MQRNTANDRLVSKLRLYNLKVLGKYAGYNKEVLIRCLTCNHEWSVTPKNITRSLKCPDCGRHKSHEQFIEEAKVNKKVTVIGKYVPYNGPILVKCNTCGKEFQSNSNRILRGHGCFTCGKLSITLGTDKLLARLTKYRPTMEILDTPKLITDLVRCRCSVCNLENKRTVSVILRSGCKRCNHLRQRKSNEKFLADLKRVLPDVTALTTYDGAKNNISVRCDIDGYEWDTTPDELLCSYGCKQCTKTGFNVGKTGYLYVYSFQEYCGFGITTNVRQRHLYHTKTFKSHKIEATLDFVYSGDGQVVWDVERHLKVALPCYNTGVEGFKTEAILDTHKMLLLEILNSYIKSGVLTIEKV